MIQILGIQARKCVKTASQPNPVSSYTNSDYPDYKLVFQDDFKSLNASAWQSVSEANRGNSYFLPFGGFPNDNVCYVDEAITTNGKLTITASKTPSSDPICNNKPMSSGRLTSFGKLAVKPGSIVEASIKTTSKSDYFSAFWMLPNIPNWNWPSDGEIDIMELFDTTTTEIRGTLHMDKSKQDCYKFSSTSTTEPIGSQFHTFTAIIDTESVEMKMDGNTYLKYSKNDLCEECGGSSNWPIDHIPSWFVIFNVNAPNKLPQESSDTMLVDWLRIYEK
eukprot:NODE_547_length_6185_cov_0.654124.p3 type:complete len:277 gc:universal NODE_547_length_6185_cov_0.654124:5135-5965(+)